MEGLDDLKIAVRSFKRQPAFALAAVATLAIGFGATTAIFSTVNAALLRPLPYPRSEDLRTVADPFIDGRYTSGLLSPVEIIGLIDPALPIVHAAGSGTPVPVTIVRDDDTPVAAVMFGVTDGFFEMFGLPVSAGRAFTASDRTTGAAPAAVLSYRIWRDLFRSDPAIIGKPIRLANGPVTVIGVASRDFDIPHGADLWGSLNLNPQATGHGFNGYLRVKPGTPPERLRDELTGVMARLGREYGAAVVNRRYEVRPLVSAIVGDLRTILIIVMGGAALLLVLACVNVTNLLLARGAVRAREIAVRVALGASRGRILRQLLTESLVLSAAGALAGLLLAYVGVRLLLVLGARELPRLDRIPFDLRVLGFAVATMFVTGIVVGFAPALRLASTGLRTLMSESGRGTSGGSLTHRALKSLIVAEIALAITLVAGAGWLVSSFRNLAASNPGFVTNGRLVFDLTLPFSKFPAPGQATAWSRELLENLRAINGVTAAASTATFPLGPENSGKGYVGIHGESVDLDHPLAGRQYRISPDFFEAMGTRLLSGRPFSADDRQGTALVAIVNESFARLYLAGRDPLAVKITFGYPDPRRTMFTVVGVVEDVKYVSLALPADPAFYVPEMQGGYLRQTVVLRTSLANPSALAPTVRAAVKAMDPLLPVDFRLLEDMVSSSLGRQRHGMMLMLVFAATALTLAAVGIYGVIAYTSAQRTGEMAMRMALGATRRNVFWLLMRQARTLAIVGTTAGIIGAYAAGRIVSSWLFEVRASDPLILAAATAIVLGITLLAIAWSARLASRVDPAAILRG